MSYTHEAWTQRSISRMDYGGQITHLTRKTIIGGQEYTALDVLIKILRERKIVGSTNAGFVMGNRSAVCFQDAPLYSICENVDYEIKLAQGGKFRYEACGILFQKPYIYQKGGRPVIYEKKETAKLMLPETEYWRIVNFDLSNPSGFIDWTHEREWRIPGDFEFDIETATVVVMNAEDYKKFYELSALEGDDVARMVNCVVPLGAIFT